MLSCVCVCVGLWFKHELRLRLKDADFVAGSILDLERPRLKIVDFAVERFLDTAVIKC